MYLRIGGDVERSKPTPPYNNRRRTPKCSKYRSPIPARALLSSHKETKTHWHYNSGARVQALGARMRRAFDNVGAMQSTVTGVVTNSDFTPAPYKMMGKAT